MSNTSTVAPAAPAAVAPVAPVATKAAAKLLTPFSAIVAAGAKASPSLKPSAVFDALAAFAKEIGLPWASAAAHREDILRLSGVVTKARFTGTGSRSTVAVNLVAAAKALPDKEAAKAAAACIKRAAAWLADVNGEAVDL